MANMELAAGPPGRQRVGKREDAFPSPRGTGGNSRAAGHA